MKKNVSTSRQDRIFQIINVLLMTIVCVIIVYPLYYVLLASFTDPDVVKTGKLLLLPESLYFEGYKKALTYSPLWKGYANTVKYTLAGTLCSLFCTVPGAYALSRRDMAGRRFIMFLFTFTMFFSGGIIPMYLVIKKLNIYDTMWALVLPSAISVYNMIVCRSFFDSSIPDELLEAAKVDGCSDFGFFLKIALPLSKTIMAVICLFYATAMWNQFFNPLMFLAEEKNMPLQVVLRNLILMNQAAQMDSSASDMAAQQKIVDQLKYCIVVVSALPLLSIYPFLQKYFAKGVTIGAVKG